MRDEADPEDVEDAVEAVETACDWVRVSGENQPAIDLVGVLDERDGSPDHLTIVPQVPEGDVPTQWVAASGDAFVHLEEVR